MRARINEEAFEGSHGSELLNLIEQGSDLESIRKALGYKSVGRVAPFLNRHDLYQIWKRANIEKRHNKTADRLVYSGLTLQQIAKLSG